MLLIGIVSFNTVSIVTVCYLITSMTNAAFYQKLITDDGSQYNQRYGAATLITNDTAFIGAPNDGGNFGAVYVFSYNGSYWKQTQKLTPNATGFGSFGHCIDYDTVNNDLIIGEHNYNDYRGAAHIFNKNASNQWIESQILIPFNADSNDQCGIDVCIENNVAVMGCYHAEGLNGAIRIFEKSGTWSEVIKITPNDATSHENFGYSVDISGGKIIVGSRYWGTSQGAAYIIEKDINYGITQRLYPSDSICDYCYFGFAVSIYNDKLVVGAYGYNTNMGKVYIYVFNGLLWSETITITGEDGDEFGHSTQLYNNTLAIGSPDHNDYAQNSGSVYIYEIDNNNWTQTAKLSPPVSSNARAGYSHSISLWDNNIVVGAPQDNYGPGGDAGSTYIYQRYGNDLEWIPTETPTQIPTNAPTQTTSYPTINPTQLTSYPTTNPTKNPTQTTIDPTTDPTTYPTRFPTQFTLYPT
eukprot:143041_1